MKFSLVFQAISLAVIGHQLGVTSALDISSRELGNATADSVRVAINKNQNLLKRRTSGENDNDNKKKPWGQVIGFTLIVNLVTFAGVILLTIPSVRAAMKKSKINRNSIAKDEEHAQDEEDMPENESQEIKEGNFFGLFVPSFACGALFATVLFLILPESITLITRAVGVEHSDRRILEGDDNDEHGGEIPVGAIWRFGASVLGGFLLSPVMTLVFPHPSKQDDTSGNTINYSIAAPILLGDFFHNFGDGVFIGIAFMLCDDGLAYTIAAVTVYHEIAQEIADFFLLTGFAGLSIVQALVVNFVSGLSVLLGGIFVLAMDVSDMTIGVILALSCGIYIYIACTESFPKARKNMITRSDFAIAIGSFLIGVIPIGLALINHSHC